MPNYKLTLSYEGTRYRGWQRQGNTGNTIQEKLEAALNSDEYKDLPVKFWYNGSGSADMAHDEHQIMAQKVLADMPERFTDGENYCWVEFKGGTHAYNCWLPHLYNCLKVFYK